MSSISIDLSHIKSERTKIDSELEDLNSRLDKIYRRAVISNIPVAQSIVEHFNPSPDDLKMLSKVFARLAVLITERNDLLDKSSLLNGLDTRADWLYQTVGDMDRDVDSFLNVMKSESETK